MKTGAIYKGNSVCEFTVWAPFAEEVILKIVSQPGRSVPMIRDQYGYWTVKSDNVKPGARYLFEINRDRQRPDPASFSQPDGVHMASEVIDHGSFQWHDSKWRGIDLSEMIIYELHTGTFTQEGTFDAIIPLLDDIKQTGINAIEIMPVAQFPGERNWGYDGVFLYAVQKSYGGADGLKRLVNECHRKGIAVILDVVYNHLGPEGNYLWDYGPYFTDRYKTPWGQAINFDGPYSNEVRDFFTGNALYWFENFHIDALRLDAIHGIYDMSAKHFLLELAEKTGELSLKSGRRCYLIAESDLNDPVVAKAAEEGGYGIDALWCDDFHHSVHTLLTGEYGGYYADFGKTGHLAKSLREGFVYSGQYSEFRKRNHGSSSADLEFDRFVVFLQNHDQIGNRMKGERMSSLVSFEALKLSLGVTLLSPSVPLLFMGEEYGETAPFLYFVSHSDEHLIQAVREGRKKEFESFKWHEEPPDPQSPSTFNASKINWSRRIQGHHKILLTLTKELIRLRRENPAINNKDNKCIEVWFDEEKKIIFVKRWKDSSTILLIFNFNKADVMLEPFESGHLWEKVLDSSDQAWNGPGTQLQIKTDGSDRPAISAESFVFYKSTIKG